MGLERDRAAVGRRRALLIGVKNSPYLAGVPELASVYPSLDFVERDVSLVATALDQSGYEVDVKCDDTSFGPVIAAVTDFLASCEPNDTAFLYLSGHGVTLNGRDHLVLQDSQPGARGPDGSRELHPAILLKATPAGLLGSLPQGVTAIVCLDVCRTEAPRPISGDTDAEWAGAHESYWLYSCGPGQRAYADPVSGSWFAQALAAALSRVNPPTTFRAVAEYAQEELLQLASRHPQVPPPIVGTLRPNPAQGTESRDPVVCEGTEQTLDWIRVIRESGLWRHTSGRSETHTRVQERLAELVRYVTGSGAQTRAYREDPWADPLYPERLNARLTDLVAHAGLERQEELLSPAETACLLSAAIVQEGIVAVTLDQLYTLLPDQFDPGPRGREAEPTGDRPRLMRDAARDVCRAHSLVVRTTETLRSRNLEPAMAAADHWLRHRFIADWDGLWERGGHGAIDELITKVVEAVEAAADTPAPVRRSPEERREIDGQIRQVLGHLTVKPGLSPRFSDAQHGDDWILTKPVRGNQWRGDHIARLLWAAGLLAADPRRLSSVLVDHLGAHEPLLPSAVVAALGGLDYEDTDGRAVGSRGITVRLRCPHPALHAAVEELALAADATVRAFGRTDAAPPPLLRGLPDRVTTEELRALPGRYKEPLERFRLAEDEIRPLLMGTQLYGDRMLAVRELYQNALDACRYREMRRRYGKIHSSWDGEIVFTQGWDDNRPYIECRDNGSGMSRARLTSMFARAGKRYEQDPDFVQERRNWRRAGIVDKSFNSRFGIGVFSYFMLADEVVVWTRAVDATGRAGADTPLRVDIRSGSGLLQINTSNDPEVPDDGGTRVRLYLAEPQEGEQVPSLVETLRTHLWVSEHSVTATELTKQGETFRKLSWEPRRMADRDDWRAPPIALSDEHGEGAGEAWLVQGEGKLLLDGVLIEQAPKVYGYVINLRERHAPVPSVDRNQLLSYDDELVMRELLERVPAAAGQLMDVSLPWLWELAQSTPRMAVRLIESLPDNTMTVFSSEQGRRLVQGKLRLAASGCMPTDENVLDVYRDLSSLTGGVHEHALFTRWRATVLSLDQPEKAFAPEGYPGPKGIDALLFQSAHLASRQAVLHAAAQAGRCVRKVLTALRRYAVIGIEVPEVADIRALDDLFVTQAAADLYYAYTSLAEHLSGLEHDSSTFRYFTLRPRGFSKMRPPARHAPLLAVSALHGLSLGEVADLLRQLHIMGPTLPDPPELSDETARQRLTAGEVRCLAVPRFPQSPWLEHYGWLPGSIGPVDLLSRAAPPFALPELTQRIEQFSGLGYSLDTPPTPEALDARTLPPDQQLLLSEDFDRQRPWHEGAIPLHRLISISVHTGAPLGDVADLINSGTPITGAHASALPSETADWTAPSWLANIYQGRDWETANTPVTPWEMVGAFLSQEGARMDEFRDAVSALDACGMLDWQGTDRAALERQASTPHHRLLAPYPYRATFVSCDFHHGGASIGYLMALAAHFDLELGTVADELLQLDTSLELTVPDIPSGARRLQLNDRDLGALMPRSFPPFNQGIRLKSDLTVLDILKFAIQRRRDGINTLGKAFRHLAPLATVGGVELPGEFQGSDAERLEDFVPIEFDLAAFDKGLLGPGSLGPLELVLVAGRFGWSLAKTYDRYAPFACLGLDVTVDTPEDDEADTIPDWQDVIILTTRLTGRRPALTGDVPEDHITLCAEETDLNEAGVRDRLSRYSRLFQFTLPEQKEPAS
ncbi:wHTH domain-containing protein [Streptomyces fungicidicus]